jgi:hypothetical protein
MIPDHSLNSQESPKRKTASMPSGYATWALASSLSCGLYS